MQPPQHLFGMGLSISFFINIKGSTFSLFGKKNHTNISDLVTLGFSLFDGPKNSVLLAIFFYYFSGSNAANQLWFSN